MKKGLTLIEVLLVVFLIMILFSTMAFFVPRYNDYATFSVNLNKLMESFRYAREMSIVEQENHAVRFDYENNQYETVRYSGDGEYVLKTETFDEDIKIINIDDYHEVKFTLFGGVFKTGTIKLKSSNYERIIYIKPSGFIKSKGGLSD